MADEISAVLNLQLANGILALDKQITFTADQAAQGLQHAVQEIGTSDETLALGDAGVGGVFLFLNLDAANYVEIGPASVDPATANYCIKLLAGEAALLRYHAAAVHAKANGAAVKLEYWLLKA